jgi:hypothetical protein
MQLKDNLGIENFEDIKRPVSCGQGDCLIIIKQERTKYKN